MEKAFWSNGIAFKQDIRFWSDSFLLGISYNAVKDLGNYSILLGDPSPSGEAGYVCAQCDEKVFCFRSLPYSSVDFFLLARKTLFAHVV